VPAKPLAHALKKPEIIYLELPTMVHPKNLKLYSLIYREKQLDTVPLALNSHDYSALKPFLNMAIECVRNQLKILHKLGGLVP
jgi:hypothetical protein